MSEWISVNERLPIDNINNFFNEFYVVCRTKGGELPKGYFQSVQKAHYHYPIEPDQDLAALGYSEYGCTGYWELTDGSDMSIPFDVVYWMEIPEIKE